MKLKFYYFGPLNVNVNGMFGLVSNTRFVSREKRFFNLNLVAFLHDIYLLLIVLTVTIRLEFGVM